MAKTETIYPRVIVQFEVKTGDALTGHVFSAVKLPFGEGDGIKWMIKERDGDDFRRDEKGKILVHLKWPSECNVVGYYD